MLISEGKRGKNPEQFCGALLSEEENLGWSEKVKTGLEAHTVS